MRRRGEWRRWLLDEIGIRDRSLSITISLSLSLARASVSSLSLRSIGFLRYERMISHHAIVR